MNRQTPNQCIWCLMTTPQVQFTSESHVLPECVGNLNKQILPKGVVCDQCNNYFSHSVESALIDDPTFHVLAVVLKIRNPKKKSFFRCRIFDDTHKAIGGEHQEVHLNSTVSSKVLSMKINYRTEGEIRKSYALSDLALISRAIHKIAFESYVWKIVVEGMQCPIDIFHKNFKDVRLWARNGDPQNFVRPVLRLMEFNSVKGDWAFGIWGFHGSIIVELDIFGDWYAVDLTSDKDRNLGSLREWAKIKRPDYPIWVLKEDLVIL
jgi:hypothetical protein